MFLFIQFLGQQVMGHAWNRSDNKKAFIEGFSTSVEVADAYLYLASIEIKRYQALFEMDKTLAQLLETCGLSSEYNSYITN